MKSAYLFIIKSHCATVPLGDIVTLGNPAKASEQVLVYNEMGWDESPAKGGHHAIQEGIRRDP